MDVMDFDTSHLSSICSDMLDDGFIFEASDSILDCAELCRTMKWPCIKFVKNSGTSRGAKTVNKGSADTENFTWTLKCTLFSCNKSYIHKCL